MVTFAETWKAQCPLKDGQTYLNSGTLGPTLKVVTDKIERLRTSWIQGGPGAALQIPTANGYFDMMAWNDRARRIIAKWLATDPTSIALTGNATDGINFALNSMAWKQGDRVLTTQEEHAALTFPLSRISALYGVAIDLVPFPKDGDDQAWVGMLQRAITPRTRLLACSSVSHVSGVGLDLKRLLEAVRNSGVWVLVDGSHSAGTRWPLLYPGMDFYVFPGHKWLYGPVGCGVLWVSSRALSSLDGPNWGAPMIGINGERLLSRDAAWRYEYGTRDWSVAAGLAQAVEFRTQWAELEVMDYYTGLNEQFRIGVCDSGYEGNLVGEGAVLRLVTPFAESAAIAVWKKHHILVKPDNAGMRISLPPWMTAEEVREVGTILGDTVKDAPTLR